MEGEEWLEDSMAAIGEVLSGCDRLGAVGGAVPLFTDNLSVARDRAARLGSAYSALPGSRGRVRADQIELDFSDSPAQYRVVFRLR